MVSPGLGRTDERAEDWEHLLALNRLALLSEPGSARAVWALKVMRELLIGMRDEAHGQS